MDMSRPDLDVMQRAAAKYRVFNPGDRSEGFAERLAQMLADLTARRHMVEAALSYAPGTHTFDQIVAMILTGQLTLWVLPNSFMVSELQVYPNTKIFHVFLAGGDLNELLDMHPDVLPVAAMLGCSTVTLSGRPGWQRAMKSNGWKQHLVTMAREV